MPEEAYPSQLKKQNPEKLTLEFEKGHLIKINDQKFSHPSRSDCEIEMKLLQNLPLEEILTLVIPLLGLKVE